MSTHCEKVELVLEFIDGPSYLQEKGNYKDRLQWHHPSKDIRMKDDKFHSLMLLLSYRVATIREKYLENEIYSRSGKSQGIL